MNNLSLAIKSIQQIDNYTFSILWNDGSLKRYRLSDLQKKCPCAACVDENSGERRPRFIDDNVTARRIFSVGRYALRIEFTSGCSSAIFDFNFLHQMAAQ